MAKKPVKLDENGFRKFGMRDCLAYAAGDLGCNMSFALKSTMASRQAHLPGYLRQGGRRRTLLRMGRSGRRRSLREDGA